MEGLRAIYWLLEELLVYRNHLNISGVTARTLSRVLISSGIVKLTGTDLTTSVEVHTNITRACSAKGIQSQLTWYYRGRLSIRTSHKTWTAVTVEGCTEPVGQFYMTPWWDVLGCNDDVKQSGGALLTIINQEHCWHPVEDFTPDQGCELSILSPF